jgi:hypothetical protein
VRNAVSPGRARPSGPKLSVLVQRRYVLSFRSCCSSLRRAIPTSGRRTQTHASPSIDHRTFLLADGVSRQSSTGRRTTRSPQHWPPPDRRAVDLNPRGRDPAYRPLTDEGQPPRRGQRPNPIVHVKGLAIDSPAGPRPAAQHRAIQIRRIGPDGGWVEVGDRAAICELDRQPQQRTNRQRTATVVGELRERPQPPPLPGSRPHSRRLRVKPNLAG